MPRTQKSKRTASPPKPSGAARRSVPSRLSALPVFERLSIALVALLPPLVILATPDSARLLALGCGVAALLLDGLRRLRPCAI